MATPRKRCIRWLTAPLIVAASSGLSWGQDPLPPVLPPSMISEPVRSAPLSGQPEAILTEPRPVSTQPFFLEPAPSEAAPAAREPHVLSTWQLPFGPRYCWVREAGGGKAKLVKEPNRRVASARSLLGAWWQRVMACLFPTTEQALAAADLRHGAALPGLDGACVELPLGPSGAPIWPPAHNVLKPPIHTEPELPAPLELPPQGLPESLPAPSTSQPMLLPPDQSVTRAAEEGPALVVPGFAPRPPTAGSLAAIPEEGPTLNLEPVPALVRPVDRDSPAGPPAAPRYAEPPSMLQPVRWVPPTPSAYITSGSTEPAARGAALTEPALFRLVLPERVDVPAPIFRSPGEPPTLAREYLFKQDAIEANDHAQSSSWSESAPPVHAPPAAGQPVAPPLWSSWKLWAVVSLAACGVGVIVGASWRRRQRAVAHTEPSEAVVSIRHDPVLAADCERWLATGR